MIRFEHVSKAYLGGRQALQGVTFHMQPGEMAFLTGHSGAGKSTLLKLICGIERPSAGKIWFSGHDITRLKNREVPFLRRQIGMIFQDHHLLMDRTVYDNVAIPLIIAGASGDDIRRRVSAALDKVGLLDKAKNFPIQLSGGEQQRVGIARAVVNKPAVLLADEPTTALDVTIQAQILQLLRELKDEYGMAMVLVTHNLGVAAQICDRIAVMYGGHIMELGPTRELFAHPQNPYTRGLLASLPVNKRKGEPLSAIPGTPPNLGEMPVGCPFAPRCARAQDVCFSQPPAEREVGPGHTCRCHFADGPCREEDDCGKQQ